MYKLKLLLLFITTSLYVFSLGSGLVQAGGMGNHTHDDHHSGTKSNVSEHQEASSASGNHRYAKWVTPPFAYRNKVSNRWLDQAAKIKGADIYQKNCMSCHGTNGKGAGPVAMSLKHAPADLTNHFHNKPGDGDDYLYWRVSEGGLVEPFRSM